MTFSKTTLRTILSYGIVSSWIPMAGLSSHLFALFVYFNIYRILLLQLQHELILLSCSLCCTYKTYKTYGSTVGQCFSNKPIGKFESKQYRLRPTETNSIDNQPGQLNEACAMLMQLHRECTATEECLTNETVNDRGP